MIIFFNKRDNIKYYGGVGLDLFMYFEFKNICFCKTKILLKICALKILKIYFLKIMFFLFESKIHGCRQTWVVLYSFLR